MRLEAVIGDTDSDLPAFLRSVLAETCVEIRALAERVEAIGRRLEELGRHMPVVAHLSSIPGIGVLSATALVALVGDVRRFRSGRHFASYLGLVPREFSSGETQRRGRITKRHRPSGRCNSVEVDPLTRLRGSTIDGEPVLTGAGQSR